MDTSSVSKEYVLQFELASITAPVLVDNVFYAFDSAELTDSSTLALDSLVTLMEDNPNITIELSSHCDYRGRDEYNIRLSQRRAESVVKYLIARRRYRPSDSHRIRRDTPESHPQTIDGTVPFLHENDTLTEAFKKTAGRTAGNLQRPGTAGRNSCPPYYLRFVRYAGRTEKQHGSKRAGQRYTTRIRRKAYTSLPPFIFPYAYFNPNFTGKENNTLTGLPFLYPGFQSGIMPTTLTASCAK